MVKDIVTHVQHCCQDFASLPIIYNHIYPIRAASKEAISTLTLAISCTAASLKANRAIKTDMVKPIPANIPAPISCDHDTPSGRELHFSCTSKKQADIIPSGLPIAKPKLMP